MDKWDSILILMPTLFVGGSELQVRYIIEGLDAAGKKVIVLVENGNPDDKQNKSYISEHAKVKFIFLKQHTFLKTEKNKINKVKSLSCIIRWILKYGKKENIKWAMFTNLTGLFVVPVCKVMGINVLFNERNPGVKMCDNIAKRMCLKMCNKIVANSKSASEYMSRTLKRNVECINNGIKAVTKANSKHSDAFIILIPARITRIKNQMVVVKAMSILRDMTDFKILFAGQIEDTEYANEITTYIVQNGLQERIKLLGYVSDMQRLYDETMLVILPSYEEGTPNVMLEAYLYKKLCLASDIIMNRNAACDSSILFRVNDPKDLADKILWIMELDEHEKSEMIRRNYDFVCDNYALEVMQRKYIDIFDN